MTIQYHEQLADADILTLAESLKSVQGSYICVSPSIGIKECDRNETLLSRLYERYPHADYYGQYSSTGKRAKPGDLTKYPATANCPGIINMFIKVYPGTKTYPNDNSEIRLANFSSVLRKLSDQSSISTVYLLMSTDSTYIATIEDYISTCKLNGSDVCVHVYAPGPASVQATTRAPAIVKYRLEYTNVCNEVLYEVDFALGTPAPPAEGTPFGEDLDTTIDMDLPGVLRYFPPGWESLLDDPKLTVASERVMSQLEDVIGQSDVFPPATDIFNAFKYCSRPKVVILGQDPYHAPGEAHGLSFSVQKGVKVPPSLVNIYSALENDVDVRPAFRRPRHGCLEDWAKQGVILLNSGLTVKQAQPKSHVNIWSPFTDRLIQLLGLRYPNLIFVLWGGDARKKSPLISGHTIFEFNHPSGRIPNNTFGSECKHFSQINEALVGFGDLPIDWSLRD